GRTQPIVEGILQLRIEAAGDTTPHDPIIGAALGQARHSPARLDARRSVQQLPELFDAELVERVAEAGTKTVADKMIPAREMRGRAPALFRRLGEEFPQPAAQPGGPFVPRGVESRFQHLGQILRERAAFFRLKIYL